MLTLPLLPVQSSPFPHVTTQEFLPPDRYRELLTSFPTCPPSSGPTGFSYFRGDPEYDNLISTNEAWSWFFNSCQSEAFVAYCLRQFAGAFTAPDCLVDPGRAQYVDYCESRSDKERHRIANVIHSPEQLWIRLDILQGRIGYGRAPHLDHRRRLLTMLVYFSDAVEDEMKGGSLHLHGCKSEMQPEDIEFAPRHNLMVAFACNPQSFHSVAKIEHQKAPRNFVQITVSSSVDAWTH